MTNLIEELKDVFEIANNVTSFIKNIKESIKKEKSEDKQVSSGNASRLAASGNASRLAASGNASRLAASGDASQLAASGNASRLAASGDASQLAASGSFSQLAASGDASQLAASGDASQLAASGSFSQLAASGSFSQLAASGSFSQLESTGKKSVCANIGRWGVAKAKTGSWITLAEFKNEDGWKIDFVKTEYVDGKNIREDIFYTLCEHKFREYREFDGIKCAVISHKKDVYKVKNFGEDFYSYVVEKDDVYAHGKTIKEARESFIYKISNRDTTPYKSMSLDSVLSFEDAIKMYRVITGACEAGTKYFVSNLPEVKKEYSIREIIELTKGQYGNETLREFFEVNHE